MTVVRMWTLDDVPALVEMAQEFIEHTKYRALVGLNIDQIVSLIHRILDDQNSVGFVAMQQNETVGMLAVSIATHPISNERIASEICWWVKPAARSSRAGFRLLHHAEEWAQQHGANRFQMIAPNEKVGDFYRQAGYTFVETTFQKDL